MEASLKALGLASFQVTTQSIFDDCVYISVALSWKMATDVQVDAPPAKRQCRGNHQITCGLCHEGGVAMRLAPCGHMVCQSCAAKQLKTCPFCRSAVAETEELFE